MFIRPESMNRGADSEVTGLAFRFMYVIGVEE